MVERIMGQKLKGSFSRGRAILLMGARQVGKTTLVRNALKDSPDALFLNGDEQDVQDMFAIASSSRLRTLFAGKKYLVLDEAQRIGGIGLKLKLITDEIPEIRLVVTGSSSFDLANKVNEPLTGRKWEHILYPLSFAEMAAHHGLLEEKRLLPHRLVYGYYPEVVCSPGRERDVLHELTDSYLYKDLIILEGLQKPEKLMRLLQALAYQVGNQVSYNELARLCDIDSKTVEKYITLLEKCFVVFRLSSLSRNRRNELKNSRKIYFYDNGVRNSVIADFSLAETRRDIGALWENFLVAERKKKLANTDTWRNVWFWRTTDQKEIDYIEEGDGKMDAFEFKWNPKAKSKLPKHFAESYPDAAFSFVTPAEVEDFLL